MVPQRLWGVEKGILRFAMHEGAIGTERKGTLNPLQVIPGLTYFNLQHQIFETLVEIDFSVQRIVPALATDWQQLDDRTLQFHLRRGVRFHNGEPFDAAAVKFSLDALLDPRYKHIARIWLSTIKRVDIVDSHTINILLSRPDAFLLRKLGVIGFILPPKYFSRVGFDYFSRYPMGTGPFRFFYQAKDIDGTYEIHLVANENYWRVGQPYLRELICKFIPDDRQWEALKKNAVDLVIDLQIGPGDELKKPDSIQLIKHETLRNAICLLNIDRDGPLRDLRVRTALQHTVNRQALVTTALRGYGKPLFSIAPEGSLGYNPDPYPYSENVRSARELLRKAGYPDGFTLKVLCGDRAPTPQVVAVLQEQLKQIGVSFEVHARNREKIFDEIVNPKLLGAATYSKYDMLVITGRTDIFGSGYYFDFFHSTGMFNPGIYAGKESPLDTLYDKAMDAPDEAVAKHQLQALDRYIVENALAIPLYQDISIFGMQKNVNWKSSLIDFPHRFRDCY